VGARRRDPLRVYALCEAGIGACCAASPWTFAAIKAIYVALASGTDPGAPGLVALQVALGGLALLPPTVLMADPSRPDPPLRGTRPVARQGRGPAVWREHPRAAAGALLTGYAPAAAIGVIRTTLTAVAANFRWQRQAWSCSGG